MKSNSKCVAEKKASRRFYPNHIHFLFFRHVYHPSFTSHGLSTRVGHTHFEACILHVLIFIVRSLSTCRNKRSRWISSLSSTHAFRVRSSKSIYPKFNVFWERKENLTRRRSSIFPIYFFLVGVVRCGFFFSVSMSEVIGGSKLIISSFHQREQQHRSQIQSASVVEIRTVSRSKDVNLRVFYIRYGDFFGRRIAGGADEPCLLEKKRGILTPVTAQVLIVCIL